MQVVYGFPCALRSTRGRGWVLLQGTAATPGRLYGKYLFSNLGYVQISGTLAHAPEYARLLQRETGRGLRSGTLQHAFLLCFANCRR